MLGLKHSLLAGAAVTMLGIGAFAIADDATTMPSTPEPHSGHVRIPAPFNLIPDLSDDQKAKAREIHGEILDEERQLRQKERDEISAILTDDQKKELSDLESKAALERRASEEEKRAKNEEEKAEELKNKLDGGAATQPSGGQ
jgi:Spy/CpxP family protein refolding chaperone